MAIIYHVRDQKDAVPTHTLAFDFDNRTKTMYVSWAMPTHKDFVKKQCYNMAMVRLQRLKAFDQFQKQELNTIKVPRKVYRSIERYLDRAERYFKSYDPQKDNLMIYT